MVAWTKHFSIIKSAPAIPQIDTGMQAYSTTTARTSSWLNIAYQGNPQRIPRYYQFQEMDSDSDINTALDTIADFCTQSEEQTEEPFEVQFNGEPNESETKIIKQMLDRWININSLKSRLWYMFRDTIKNGDAFFLRDPETQEWLWLDHFMVELVKVDETKGKIPDEYIVRGLDYNRQSKFGTKQADPNAYRTPFGTTTIGGARPMSAGTSGPAQFNMAGAGADQRQRGMQGPYSQELSVIDANHIVHLSLSIGNDINWPFGSSILEPIFKTYKQKELLEDAIIIYRVQRAPERRIFYIDVGTMPPERAKRHIEAIKNDIHQRRIPNRCLSLDTKIYLLDGRLLPLRDVIEEYTAGKQNWVYSCNPATGAVVPGKITWAGETKKQAEMVKLTLDNGETIVCTPDHAFPILGKGFVQAQCLEVGESFIPLYFREKRYSKYKNPYTQIFDNETKVWTYTHKMVADYFADGIGEFTFQEIHAHAPKDTIGKTYAYLNHKLVSIEKMDERQDTGTITVDGSELYHSYHTFAIEGGIFTKNSGGGTSILDTAYNPLCLSLNTVLHLVDGRSLSLSDLIMEYRDGKENWIYSCNPRTGDIITGPITWAGITRKDAKVVCVTLDNGGAVIVTPDHKFPLLGGATIAACDLMPEHELISFKRSDGLIVHPVSVVELQDKIDVGTITVDKDEKYHPFHNFAISENIFLQNSINDDYFFACLQLKTKILLLDGRAITLEEIIDEHKLGKENWVYSQNTTTHELEPGRIKWAAVTRKDAEMVRVTLDNGEHIDVTPDHRFISRDGVEIAAGDLKDGQSLMPLYLRYGRTGPRQKNAGYTRYLCNATSKTKFVHSTMCPKPCGRSWVVHHKDFNGENNNPTNLEAMTHCAHKELHHSAGTYSLNHQWNDETARAKIVAGMRKLYDEASPEFIARLVERNRANGRKTWENIDADRRAKLIEGTKRGLKLRNDVHTLCYSTEMFDRLVELFNDGYTSVATMCAVLRNDEKFRSVYQSANSVVRRDRNQCELGAHISDRTLNRTVRVAGYSSWGDFKTNYSHNHKVVSVELLPYREDTGDIQIETPSGSHIFALAAGIYVHNSGADGRGSKVETLPGGDGNNEILDLTFFSKKLARGLRVPTSYLNIGDDESTGVTFNDGKLGAAMIQEFRFSKYCMRLQSLLAPKFDHEFKRYLQKNGIEIEPSLFELQFNPPQSFTRYRQIELDTQRVAVYQGVAENKRLAERFKFKRFLGLSEDEIIENEEMWAEENADKLKKKTGASPAEAGAGEGLSAVGIHPEGMEGVMPGEGEMPEEPPAEGGAPGGTAAGPPPAAPAAAPAGPPAG